MVWDKLRSLVLEEDPAKSAAPQNAAPIQPAASAVPPGTTTAAAPILYQAPGANQEMVQLIKKSIFSRSSAFTTLMAAAEKLESFIPDVVTRYKAAWSTSSGGRSAQDVINALQTHLLDVDNEERRFQALIEEQRKGSIGVKQTRVVSLRGDNDDSRAKIQALTAQIQGLTEHISKQELEISSLESEITAKNAELESTLGEFKVAAASVRDELNQYRSSIAVSL